MVSALVESGLREQAAKHRARALELWNRALAFEPDNQAVLTELRRLERGERLRRWVIGGTVLGILVAMATGALFLARKALSEKKSSVAMANAAPARKPGAAQSPAQPTTGDGTLAQRAPSASRGPGGGPAHAAREARHREAASAEKAPTRDEEGGKTVEDSANPRGDDNLPPPNITLTLGFTPARVEVWMDGKKAFDYGPQQNRIEIPWNKPHRLEFRNDSCCNRKEVMVGPQLFRPPGDHLFVNLDPKPARLAVTLEPPMPGATLLIREVNESKANPWRARALAGEKIPVPFDAGDEMRKSLEVVVFKGDKTTTNQVTITAGETRPVTIHVDD
jgi:hypothetical protein